MEENTSTEQAPESTLETAVETVEETQSTDAQSEGQVDTSSKESLSSEMGIQEKETESETSEPALPSIDDIVNEYLSGEISDETKELVDKEGLGKHLDILVAGHKAIQAENNKQIFEVAGGEKSYAELQEWGKNTLTKEEQSAFNDALFSGNMEMAKLAVQGLQSRYVAQNGKSPSRVIEGGGAANEENRPFKSVVEYIDVTRTQEYKRNPEYRAQVEAKRNKSGF